MILASKTAPDGAHKQPGGLSKQFYEVLGQGDHSGDRIGKRLEAVLEPFWDTFGKVLTPVSDLLNGFCDSFGIVFNTFWKHVDLISILTKGCTCQTNASIILASVRNS